MKSFSVSYDFVEKYVRFSKPEYIQVYLYLQYLVDRDGTFPSKQQISQDLDIAPEHVDFILDFWVSRGELLRTGTEYAFLAPSGQTTIPPQKKPDIVASPKRSTRPSYSMAEIDAVASTNKSISGLFYQAETVLHKILTQADMEMLYSFVDWLGLPVEVITMLLSYGAKRGKTGRRYLETVAMDWADRGIDTFEAAEAYVSELEERDTKERKICSILGIYDRALTTTEKKYLKQWAENPSLSPELITLAYDRTVANTGKLSLNYMNKILQNWLEAGLSSEEEVKSYEAETRPRSATQKKNPKSNGFVNYVDTNSVDYDKLEEQLLDLMLDNGNE